MATKSKTKVKESELLEDAIPTAAGQTIVTKTGVLADVAKLISGMNPEDLTHWYWNSVAQIGHEADAIPDGTAEKNQASIAAKTVAKEEVEAMFNGTELTEEFKEKATTLFEAAVNAKVNEKVLELEEEFDSAIESVTDQLTEEMINSVDSYLTRAVNEWLAENEVAIESGLKSELSESLLEGLRNLLIEHNMDVPEGSEDALELMESRVSELEAALNEKERDNLAMEEALVEFIKKDIISEASEGLTLAQSEKLALLSEDLEFVDPETYVSKVNTIKEHHFLGKTLPPQTTNILNESYEGEDETQTKTLTPEMARYHNAISRTVVKR